MKSYGNNINLFRDCPRGEVFLLWLKGMMGICYDLKRRVGDNNVYRPLYEVASSKLARKTHVDMLNNYVEGLHREGSKAVFRYTSLELVDRFALLNAAFGEEGYRV